MQATMLLAASYADMTRRWCCQCAKRTTYELCLKLWLAYYYKTGARFLHAEASLLTELAGPCAGVARVESNGQTLGYATSVWPYYKTGTQFV